MTAKQKARIKKDLIGWSFCIIPIIVFAVFVVYPLVNAFYLSFTDYNLLRHSWIGLDNYTELFLKASKLNILLNSFKNVLIYTALVIPLTLIPPLVLAAMLHNNLKGSKTFRIMLYIPALTGSVAMALIWSWLFDVSRSPINGFLRSLDISGILKTLIGTDFGLNNEFKFLSSENTAMITLVLMVAWTGMGGNIVIFSAALQTIPGEYYEAARIDGAGAVRQFLRITMPMLMPTIYFLITMSIIGSLQLFDPVYLLTNGGPGRSTQTPAHLIYVTSFESAKRAGYGSAIAVVLFFVVMLITFLFQKVSKEQLI